MCSSYTRWRTASAGGCTIASSGDSTIGARGADAAIAPGHAVATSQAAATASRHLTAEISERGRPLDSSIDEGDAARMMEGR